MSPQTRARRRIERPATQLIQTPTATERALRIMEIYDQILSYLTLIDLCRYRGVSKTCASDFSGLLAKRVRRYTRPFFPTTLELEHYFEELEIRRTWIVGSVPLAVLSTTITPPCPSNLNAMAPFSHYEHWLHVMCDGMGFEAVSNDDCEAPFELVAEKFVRFAHPAIPDKTITFTFSRQPNFFELFFSGNTNQHNAISAREVLCTTVNLTSNLEAVRGWWCQPQALADERDIISNLQLTSPFEDLITLHPNTSTFQENCGWACSGVWRYANGLEGIGHWSWGGIDGCGGTDPLIPKLARSRIKWRTGDFCSNPHCYLNKEEEVEANSDEDEDEADNDDGDVDDF
ncbi:hypothetical protein B0H11DRAFT_2225108 [Mycena galericulata]|nr:hypothetical protein B0H11DRAFT_2225108 [Mycena galericulata]